MNPKFRRFQTVLLTDYIFLQYIFILELPISPRSRSSSFNKDGFRGSHDSLLKEAAKQRASSDTDAKYFKGSHPNLSELHKIRAATLPRSGFRTGIYHFIKQDFSV